MKIVQIGIVAVSLFFAACASTIFTRVETPDLGPSRMAEVNFLGPLLRVDTFNGKNVYDKWYKDEEKTASSVNVRIPAGNTNISSTIRVPLRNMTETQYYTVSNVLFSYTFEPGKKYTLICVKMPKTGNGVFMREKCIVRMRVYSGIHDKIDAKKNKHDLLAEVYLFDTDQVYK
jgi:hypothetical protein